MNDFSALTDFIYNLFQLEFKQRNIDFSYNFEKNVYFNFDYDKIKQVMINLIQNSIDAIGSDGKIEIEYFKINDVHQIKIKDSGKGISEEIRNKIFNLYFTTKSNGNGLGLAIVYKIIMEHSGKIYFESFAGKGTTFVIELPEKSNE